MVRDWLMQADMKNVNMLQLEALVHLVEERSFSRAAKRMHLTQPSLTKHIRNVEDALGAKVVNRASRAFTLDARGSCRLRLRPTDPQAPRGGCGPGDAGRVQARRGISGLPRAPSRPRTSCPPRSAGSGRSIPGSGPPCGRPTAARSSRRSWRTAPRSASSARSPSSAKLADEPLWQDRMVLAVPAAHPWARRRTVRVREIEKEPFVIREKGSGTREAFERVPCRIECDGPVPVQRSRARWGAPRP